MRTKLFSAVAISALLFASCSNDDYVTPNGPQAVKFGAIINKAETPQPRAAGDTWAASDAIGIYMVNNGDVTIAENTTNKQHTTTGGSSFAPAMGNEIYYPVDGAKKVDFIAYYPYWGGQVLGNYNVNVAYQSSQPAIDLLWSKANNGGSGYDKTSTGNIPLVFDHQLSKVIIKTTAGDGLTAGDLIGMTVTIKEMNTKAKFNLSTAVLDTYSAVADIVPYTKTNGEEYEAIVLPANFDAGDLVITFTIGSDVFTWKNPALVEKTFEAGKQYTYNMTINRTGVDFDCTIKAWDTTPGGRTGTAD